MQNSIARADYDAMVDRIGQEEADRRVREYGWEVLPAEGGVKAIPASQVNNLLGQGGLSMAMGGGDKVEDEDPNVADEDAADQDAAGSEGQYAGGLDAINMSNPQDVSKAILANARAQKQYYDQLAEQIKNRRYGPSESEKLFALSAALASPTKVRGLSGVLSNVMPVLQKFGELRRTGEEQRTQALQELAKQRMQLAQGNVKTALDLQRLMRTYPTGLTYDTQRGVFVDKNNPRPTQTVYAIPGTNRELVQWQDGLWRESMPDGSMKVFERSGDNFKELRVERAS